ncbi:MAG: DinB family protein [Bryobacterales bacterium]|nr:DinB family protein [Bryobacterales bacterium]
MAIAHELIRELEREAETTRRVLERAPEENFTWRPHAKSMSLGQLAHHVATLPGMVAGIIAVDNFEVPSEFRQEEAKSREEILEGLSKSVAAAKEILSGMDDAQMAATWSLIRGGQSVFSLPRAEVCRSILLNHWYHHRGQLTVYLRLLDVPLPSVYGPTADENPFTYDASRR